MRAIQSEEFGGPEKLRLVDLAALAVGDGQVLVSVSASGVNFADTHQTQNDYLTPTELPLVPGAEVAGVVDSPSRPRARCGGSPRCVSGCVASMLAAPAGGCVPPAPAPHSPPRIRPRRRS
ncbi:MAG: alcohol dehydrogenase catalytic domain-containing protein [Thermoleophilaceae bacterium]|nr:alcohol dehydrogenase catalytic domain-containing protein [Thermoleophilaceae bacterium]